MFLHAHLFGEPLVREEYVYIDAVYSSQGALDLKALGRMMLAFRLKLHQVCSMQSAMVASCLGEVIKVKVQQVTERDPTTRELFVIPGEGVRRAFGTIY